MSPAKSKKAAKKAKGKTPARKASKARAPRKTAKPAAPKAPPAARTARATGHAHCAASDPFGDACQNLPRRPSKYCVIHSYLER